MCNIWAGGAAATEEPPQQLLTAHIVPIIGRPCLRFTGQTKLQPQQSQAGLRQLPMSLRHVWKFPKRNAQASPGPSQTSLVDFATSLEIPRRNVQTSPGSSQTTLAVFKASLGISPEEMLQRIQARLRQVLLSLRQIWELPRRNAQTSPGSSQTSPAVFKTCLQNPKTKCSSESRLVSDKSGLV